MSAHSFLRADGTVEPPRSWWSAWLPTRAQMQQGAQAQFGVPLEPAPGEEPALDASSPWATSMRQGLGLVIVAALAAGLIPVLVQWVNATQLGTVVPLAELARAAEEQLVDAETALPAPLAALFATGQSVAGLEPALFPGWLAALLSAFGQWLNWPLRWLTWWIAYGLGVLAVAKLLGATATLQRFYALTSYAALPLVLTGLGSIPCLGPIAQIVAVLWALVVYVAAARAVTGLSLGRTVISVVLPGGIAVLVAMLLAASVAATLVRIWL